MAKATQEQITKWKKEHGDIYHVGVGEYDAYLKTPDRKTMKYVAQVANDPIRANEVLLENCWVGGDDIIKTSDELFFGVSEKLHEIVKTKEATISKL